jgi:hypothetical protein
MVVLLTVMVVCRGAVSAIAASEAQSGKSDVFVEVTDAGVKPQGFVDMVVKANIKTHEAGYYIGESAKSLHGKPGYPFVLTIDGQAIVWKVDGRKDVKPAFDEQGKTSKDPEARTGVLYALERKIRIAPGIHKVRFALPEEGYFIESEISLRDGEDAVLEFKPLYRYKEQPTRIPTFLEGIKAYEVYANGVKIK